MHTKHDYQLPKRWCGLLGSSHRRCCMLSVMDAGLHLVQQFPLITVFSSWLCLSSPWA